MRFPAAGPAGAAAARQRRPGAGPDMVVGQRLCGVSGGAARGALAADAHGGDGGRPRQGAASECSRDLGSIMSHNAMIRLWMLAHSSMGPALGREVRP